MKRNNIIIYMQFEEHLLKYLSKDEINKLMNSLSESDKKAIYLNEDVFSSEELLKIFPNVKPHPVVKNGFVYDKNEYELGKKIYHELGAYYIQEPSAMLVANFLDPKEDDLVLDLCAAPGGKTIQTALKMQNKGAIIANDLSKTRANILLSNIERLGISNTIITSLDFSKQYTKFLNHFDKIILDAPCSGSGMFRKSEEMRKDWSLEKVTNCAQIQKDLILMCYKMLKEGGTLIYSTCSYSYEEDEEIIEFLLNNSDAKLVNIPSFEGEYRSNKYKETVHLFPHLFPGEGHYIAKIQKPGTLVKTKFKETIYSRKESSKSGNQEINKFISNYELPKNFDSLCLRPGLFKETLISNKVVPSHHYAKCKNDLDTLEVNNEELLKYLTGESLDTYKKNGYYVVKYKNMNVGIVHVVNGIAKNLYPKGLRLNSVIVSRFNSELFI